MMNIRDPDTEEEAEKELLPPNPNMPTDDDAFSLKKVVREITNFIKSDSNIYACFQLVSFLTAGLKSSLSKPGYKK